jgi:CubicO group peptidase (beta-lactamase class C family)
MWASGYHGRRSSPPSSDQDSSKKGGSMAGKIPLQGTGYKSLELQVDALVKDLMTKTTKKMPGMTVAVTQHGKLKLIKGYGKARAGSSQPMGHHMRSLQGSTSKVLECAPSLVRAMETHTPPIDPKITTVFGPKGIFKDKYKADLMIGVRRHTPVVAFAIGLQDKAYAWHTDGTMSTGTSSNLGKTKPVPYVLPAGKRPVDIRAISFGESGETYTYYDDETFSIGNPTHLGPNGIVTTKVDGKVVPALVKQAKGGKMLAIVGIAISKSNNVYVFYENSKVSSGTVTDFGAHSQPVDFDSGAGGKPWEIRDVDISAEGHFYAWFSNGRASSGTVEKLDKRQAPYEYTLPVLPKGPNLPDWQSWYSTITIQNLLDHKSGFIGGGDADWAQKMFGASPETLTSEQLNMHYLRTTKLFDAPGKTERYANRNFGELGLVIEAITGQPYRQYSRDHHLLPLGLQDQVIPHSGTPDDCDAADHGYDGDGKPVAITVEASRLGLAAGGFRAAAQGSARIMVALQAKYTATELDHMGWARDKKGRLGHSGALRGGLAYVTMFPDGYLAADGGDLSRVTVAVHTNIWADGDELRQLALDIAEKVPAAAVPASYDLWPDGPFSTPCECSALKAKVTNLNSEIKELKGDFDDVAPSGKAALAQQIKKLEAELTKTKDYAQKVGCTSV